jgi:hypothetical protein
MGQAHGARQFTNADAIDALFPIQPGRSREDRFFVRGGLIFCDFHETAPVAQSVALGKSVAERLVFIMGVI